MNRRGPENFFYDLADRMDRALQTPGGRRDALKVIGGTVVGITGLAAAAKIGSDLLAEDPQSTPPTKKELVPIRPKVVLYDQTDPQWQTAEMWDPETTCGPTTLAMVLSGFGEEIKPTQVDRVFQRRGIRKGKGGDTLFRNGVGTGGVVSWLKEKGVNVTLIADRFAEQKTFDFEAAEKLLVEGNLIIASGMVKWINEFNDSFPNGVSHIFGIKAVNKEKNTFTVFDPWKGKETEHSFSEMSQFFYAYAVKPGENYKREVFVPEKVDRSPAQPNLAMLYREKTTTGERIVLERARSFLGLTPEANYYDREERRVNRTTPRRAAEGAMFNELSRANANAADILSGLSVAWTVNGRAYGMELLWQMRQKGELKKYGINPLEQPRIDWAFEHGIDPRTLAVAREAKTVAREILNAGRDMFFDAMPQSQRATLDLDDVLPNPGLMAKLMQWETGIATEDHEENAFWALVNVGQGLAYKEVNTGRSYFPSASEDLNWLATHMERATKLPFIENKFSIPGSLWVNQHANASGGAVGPQIMPIYLRLFTERFNEANRRLGYKYPPITPFDPYGMVTLAYLFLSSEIYRVHGNTQTILEYKKPGYNVNKTEEDKLDVLSYWNPLLDQQEDSLHAGYDYFNAFGRN